MTMLQKEESYRISKPTRGFQSTVPERESILLQQCKMYLDARDDIFYRRIEANGKVYSSKGAMNFLCSSMKGFSDLLIVCEGKPFFVELKIWGGSLSKPQARFLLEAERAGASAGCVLSLAGLVAMLNAAPSSQPSDWLSVPFGRVALWY